MTRGPESYVGRRIGVYAGDGHKVKELEHRPVVHEVRNQVLFRFIALLLQYEGYRSLTADTSIPRSMVIYHSWRALSSYTMLVLRERSILPTLFPFAISIKIGYDINCAEPIRAACFE
jgi:hypothetical protein